MRFLVVGLGNPGKTYLKSRHNLGFSVADKIAQVGRIDLSQKKYFSHSGSGTLMGHNVLIMKPMTYMNLSGKAVAAAVNYLRIGCEQIAIVYDDMDLALGRVHIKQHGGAGGHKGVRSVLDALQCDDFTRFRMGIGHPTGPIDPADYVLQPFGKEELPMAEQLIERGRDAILCWIKDGLTAAMNRYNPWPLTHGA